MAHAVYTAIVNAVRAGVLAEPFSRDHFRRACPGFGKGTYQAFLDKHRQGNPGGNTQLFDRIATGQYRCIRPFLYGLCRLMIVSKLTDDAFFLQPIAFAAQAQVVSARSTSSRVKAATWLTVNLAPEPKWD
jgi:hypothetical protein